MPKGSAIKLKVRDSINCCNGCEKRFPGCSTSCEEYKLAREKYEMSMGQFKKQMEDTKKIGQFDFNKFFGDSEQSKNRVRKLIE